MPYSITLIQTWWVQVSRYVPILVQEVTWLANRINTSTAILFEAFFVNLLRVSLVYTIHHSKDRYFCHPIGGEGVHNFFQSTFSQRERIDYPTAIMCEACYIHPQRHSMLYTIQHTQTWMHFHPYMEEGITVAGNYFISPVTWLANRINMSTAILCEAFLVNILRVSLVYETDKSSILFHTRLNTEEGITVGDYYFISPVSWCSNCINMSTAILCKAFYVIR